MGGVEAISEALSEELVHAGIELKVVTDTPFPADRAVERSFPYEVIRCPHSWKKMQLALWADIIHSNSASVALWPFAELARRPFIWTHNGYQVACIDGLGWEHSTSAPIAPRASFWHHWRLNGPLAALKGGFKLIFRRWLALRGVTLNIPATHWVSQKLRLPRSFQAYTPYPTKRFAGVAQCPAPDATYLYVGRLVSEKGVDVLLHAFQQVLAQSGREHDRLLIIGDGPIRKELEQWVAEQGLGERVIFTGSLRGDALRDAMGRADIAIVPSTWEEPMGGVTLELMMAGRALIVSASGGHAEVAGGAALTFPNGDGTALVACMTKLAQDPEARQRLREATPARLEAFTEEALTRRYIAIYKTVVSFWNG